MKTIQTLLTIAIIATSSLTAFAKNERTLPQRVAYPESQTIVVNCYKTQQISYYWEFTDMDRKYNGGGANCDAIACDGINFGKKVACKWGNNNADIYTCKRDISTTGITHCDQY